MKRLGLIAGNGIFPLIFAREAKKRGIEIVAVALEEETSPELTNLVDRIHWINVGELNKLVEIFKEGNINQAVMAGQVRQRLIFENLKLDASALALLSTIKDKRGDSILKAVGQFLKRQGIELIDSFTFLEGLLPPQGLLTKKAPTKEQEDDIEFGKNIARALADLEIGQTVVVKDKAVVALEAVEGTDQAIKRGAELAGPGVVVVKMSKTNQDMRFDIPVIGPKTVKTLIEVKASVLAVEAARTLIFEKEECLGLANDNNIVITVI